MGITTHQKEDLTQIFAIDMSQSQQASSVVNPVVAELAGLQSVLQFASDLLSLMKPRVLSLLLIATCCPMFLAGGGSVPIHLLLWALVGGFLISGSASAFNCIWDSDIDAVMERTKNRPMATGRLSSRVALVFSVLIGALGLVVLGFGLNPLAAAIALFGHFFYVFVYTIWLKRSTPSIIS